MTRRTGIVLILVGIGLACTGFTRASDARHVVPISDTALSKISVTGGPCANMKCRDPEPDCIDFGCVNSQGWCLSADDTSFQEDNKCDYGNGFRCDLYDEGLCYELTTCLPNFYPCGYCYPQDCQYPLSSCFTQSFNGYDDCSQALWP